MRQSPYETRIGLYSLLSALYKYPLHEETLAGVENLAVDADSPLASGLQSMQARLKAGRTGNGSSGETNALLDELNIEMTRLIEGPGMPAVPPFASYYLNNKQLMGTPAIEARRLYLEWQVIPEGEARLPDDHISLEMGFLAHLAQEALRAENETNRLTLLSASREFIQNHLKPWLPSFIAAHAKVEVDVFFIGLTHLLQEVVEADLVWLDTVVENPQEILL